ncbi:glycoside hydrolase [Aspergillus costaricaensis CBS 115574]|uniref:Glycoside hydrolase n=1 Tax=Aspergillus costaricaensis CBS 115574 TaxID=1448317 RepID=A0ACD1ICC8_9EURO|nr:glycoside hydrolase [Aspergillus costaricaensis CBS 115574]RAK88018.1 glycoside hydrolase [Aspergillus costaricaensis CBS 115574]
MARMLYWTLLKLPTRTSSMMHSLILFIVPIKGDNKVYLSHFLNLLYWGQKGGNTIKDNDLSTCCVPETGNNLLVLAFLYEYGNGNTIPSGTSGQLCLILLSSESFQCKNLVTVLLSLGWVTGAYSLLLQQEAVMIGQHLWDAYGDTKTDVVHRPFGTTFVNGWGFDIETSGGICYQCLINNLQIDYVWAQFYNNPSCSVNGVINFGSWVTAGTVSSNAKILIGLPASPYAATGTYDGAQYYLQPSALAVLLREAASYPQLDFNINHGCNYAQQDCKIFDTGSPC